jgi:hypothetical protein
MKVTKRTTLYGKHDGMAMISMFPFVLMPMMLALGVGLTAFWIWMLIDCATNEPSEGSDKVVWILVIVLTHWIGALIYLLARRPQRIQSYGR